MAQITFTEAQKIVENAMRDVGYGGGTIENAWKDSVSTSDGKTYQIPLNLQKLRDAIARSIVDILTHTQATNSISTGNTPGTEGILRLDGDVNFNSGIVGAARLNDSVSINAITDIAFQTWMQSITTAVNTITFPVVITCPIQVNGKISSSSSSVKIGD